MKLKFPELYRIARKKNQTMADVVSTRPLNISFRRALVGEKLRMWIKLVSLVLNVGLGEEKINGNRGWVKVNCFQLSPCTWTC